MNQQLEILAQMVNDNSRKAFSIPEAIVLFNIFLEKKSAFEQAEKAKAGTPTIVDDREAKQ